MKMEQLQLEKATTGSRVVDEEIIRQYKTQPPNRIHLHHIAENLVNLGFTKKKFHTAQISKVATDNGCKPRAVRKRKNKQASLVFKTTENISTRIEDHNFAKENILADITEILSTKLSLNTKITVLKKLIEDL